MKQLYGSVICVEVNDEKENGRFLQPYVFTIGSCSDCLTVLARANPGSL